MVICGKEYEVPNVDYNVICDLDKYGVNLLSGEAPNAFVLSRAFLALSVGSNKAAGDLLMAHISENGVESLAKDVLPEIQAAIEDGGFFGAVRSYAEKKEKAKAKAERQQKAKEKVATENTTDNPFGA